MRKHYLWILVRLAKTKWAKLRMCVILDGNVACTAWMDLSKSVVYDSTLTSNSLSLLSGQVAKLKPNIACPWKILLLSIAIKTRRMFLSKKATLLEAAIFSRRVSIIPAASQLCVCVRRVMRLDKSVFNFKIWTTWKWWPAIYGYSSLGPHNFISKN